MATTFVKQTATGDGSGSDASNCMSLSTFNSTSFSAGDEVLFIGSFTGTIDIDSGGTSGNPITYKGVNASGVDDGTKATVTQSSTDHTIRIDANHVLVENFESSKTGFGNYSCFAVSGGISNNSDADDSVHLRDCVAVSNNGNGDGFAIAGAGSSTTKATFTRCEARAITGAGDFGFANFADQESYLVDCTTTSACQVPIGCVGDLCDITGGTFECGGAGADVVAVDGGSLTRARNATFIAGGSGTSANIFSTSSGEVNRIELTNCTMTVNSSSTGICLVKGLSGSGIFITGGTINLNSAPSTFMEIVDNTAVIEMTGVTVNMNSGGSRGIRAATSGGTVKIHRCEFNFSGSTDTSYAQLQVRSTSGTAVHQFIGNVFRDASSSLSECIQISSGAVGEITIANNTFYNFRSGMNVIENAGANSSATFNIDNNLFVDCAGTTLSSTTNVDNMRNNGFDNSGSTFGTNPVSGTAVFTDEAGNDFSLTSDSDFTRGGFEWTDIETFTDFSGTRTFGDVIQDAGLGDNLILESPETYFTAFRQSSQNTFTEGDGDRILLESDDNEGTLTFENVGTIEFQSVLREDKLGSNQEQANANAESSTGLLLENFGRLELEDTTGNLRLETNDTIQLEDTGFLVVESTSTYHDDVSILLETDTPIKVDGILLEDNDGFDVNYQQNIIILESGSGGDLLVLEDALREDILLNSRISLENGGKLLSEKANIAGSRANSGQQPLENFTLNSRTNPLGATPVTRPADILIKSI